MHSYNYENIITSNAGIIEQILSHIDIMFNLKGHNYRIAVIQKLKSFENLAS